MSRRARFPVFLIAFLCWTGPAPGANADGVEIVVETTMEILSRSPKAGMMNLVWHPDGSLWLHTQSGDLDKDLARSTDRGKTWNFVPIRLPDAPPNQFGSGIGISRDGRLWLIHQQVPGAGGHDVTGKALCVSNSADGGRTWKTTIVDFGPLAPGGAKAPYAMASTAWCYGNLVDKPDGTLMFSTSLRYSDWKDYQQEDQTRPGIRDVMIRSTDGGKTWGDATVVHQHATETDHAVDPMDPNHILSATRKQRMLLRGEDQATVDRLAGCPPGSGWPYKGGLLLESADGGRTFKEVPGSYTGYYDHRANILWTGNNVVIFTHNDAPKNVAHTISVLRISLDGGKTWITDGKGSTPFLAKSRKFSLVPYHKSLSVTIDMGPDRFLTVYRGRQRDEGSSLEGKFWRLKRPGR